VPKFVKAKSRPSGNDVEVNLDTLGGGPAPTKTQIIPVTPAEFKNLFQTPKLLVPAVQGKSICTLRLWMYYNVGVVFTNGLPKLLGFVGTAQIARTGMVLSSLGPQIWIGQPASGAWPTLANQPLTLKMETDVNTGGSLAADATLLVEYMLLP
jgi:hypothetical protein